MSTEPAAMGATWLGTAWLGAACLRTLAVRVAGACVLALPIAAAGQSAGGIAAPQSAPQFSGLDFGLVLDGGYSSGDLALGGRPKGLALGHTEASLGGNIDDRFAGRLTAALHDHDGSIEVELEEAFVETLTLPAGFSLRAGRFLSQIGYLNEQHVHADDFADRPLPYRAFLGSHYFDNGLRLNWVAPTPLYLRLGLEVFDGRSLIETPQRSRTVGAIALGAKVGGDLGLAHSWQAGLSYLRNRLDAAPEQAHEEGGEHDHEHDHEHGALFTGRNLWIADAVWKWAPDGNNRERQLRLSGEYFRATDLNEFATDSDRHEGWYLSAVYRFAPQWEAGVRHGQLRVREPHGDHFHDGRLTESSLMLAWKQSHYSAVRLQWTTQRSRAGFADAGDTVMLQYVMSLGGHGAHSF